MFAMNVKESAAKVRCPTLVFHDKGDELVHFEQGRRLAALIPGARFVPLPGRNHVPFTHEPAWQAFVDESLAFIGGAVPPTDGVARLTARQSEVLRLVAAGNTDKQIASRLRLSPRTVEMHVGNALRALGCRTRAEATHRAAEQRLL
jgi:DNA-binding NarL/FixJ family response regulator